VNHIKKLVEAGSEWSGVADGIYLTLNPDNGDLLARAAILDLAPHDRANCHTALPAVRRWFWRAFGIELVGICAMFLLLIVGLPLAGAARLVSCRFVGPVVAIGRSGPL